MKRGALELKDRAENLYRTEANCVILIKKSEGANQR